MSKIETMSAAVIEVIDGYPGGHQFFGNQLKDDVVRIFPDAKNMFPDTILRMARRHRRDAFRVVNRNDSLYEKVYVKPITEQIREVAPREELPVKKPGPARQMELQFFSSHVFWVVFFVFVFGVVFPSDSALAFSLLPTRIASRSASVYMPAVPMYVYGFLPLLCSRLFTASDDIFNSWDMTKTVKISIHHSIYSSYPTDQVVNVSLYHHRNILLPKWVVKFQKNQKKAEIFTNPLDEQIKRKYNVLMFHLRNNIQTVAGTTGGRMAPKRAKGVFYEEDRDRSQNRGTGR